MTYTVSSSLFEATRIVLNC